MDIAAIVRSTRAHWRARGGNGQLIHQATISTDVDITEAGLTDSGSMGGSVLTRMSSADVIDVASSSINDTSAGTGMQTVRLTGPGENYEKVTTAAISMNGTTDVPTAESLYGVNEWEGLTFGSGGTNAGGIKAREDSGGTAQGCIRAGNNGGPAGAHFHVYAKHDLLITGWWGEYGQDSVASTYNMQFKLRIAEGLAGVEYVRDEAIFGNRGGNGFMHECAIWVPEKSFVYISAIANANNHSASGGFMGILFGSPDA